MAPRKKISTEIRDFFIDSMALSIGLEAANILAGWYYGVETDHAWPWVVGPGYVAFRRFLGNSPTKAVTALGSVVPSFVGGEMDSRSYTLKYRDKLEEDEPEFIFRGKGLPVAIPESKFARFVRLAWRRQMNAVHGSQVQIMWDGDEWRGQRAMRRLTSNQVLTARYFLEVTEPRFVEPEYLACIRILVLCNLIDRRGQGRAGLLMYEPDKTMSLAISRWIGPTRSPARFPNFRAIFGTSVS